jgi:carboxyl-terminal processing protease
MIMTRTWGRWVPATALLLWSGGAASQTPTPAPVADATARATPAAPASTPNAAAVAIPDAPGDDATKVLEESIDLIQQEYVDGGVTREELVEAALRGIVDHLNRRAARDGQPPVNSLLSRRDVSRLSDSMSGQQTGIGVLARPDVAGGGIDILQVFPGSPAGRAGLRAGDRIRAINDRALDSGADLFTLLRGEDGSAVRLSVVRESGSTHESSLDLKITRSRYHVSPVVSHVLEDDVGYVRIGSFTRGTADDTAGCLLSFREQGVWGVVLDLRGNPGGSLEEATKIASMFMDPGEPILQIIGRNGEPQLVVAEGERFWNGPVMVLVDGGTASAAEALASALQTHGRTLVGEPTAGKGLGESIFSLPGGIALRLATARYVAPNGASWAARGLLPNSPVLSLPLDPGEPLDPPLRAALNIMANFRPATVNVVVPQKAATPNNAVQAASKK